jgi:hypothetical protein
MPSWTPRRREPCARDAALSRLESKGGPQAAGARTRSHAIADSVRREELSRVRQVANRRVCGVEPVLC